MIYRKIGLDENSFLQMENLQKSYNKVKEESETAIQTVS